GDNNTLAINYTGGSATVAMSGTGAAAPTANVSASPGSLSFGNVTAGSTSATQAVTVSNTGGAAATSLAVASGSSEFVVSGNNCGGTLNAGATCTFNVAYAPSAAGADSSSVSVSHASGSTSVTVGGTGTAAATPALSANPASLAFGGVTVGGSSTPMSLTISNTGGAAAASLSLANSNAARFAVSGNTCGSSLAAGASCALTVTYTPAAAGNDSGQLTFAFTGGNLTVAMSGSGTAVAAANVSVSPGSLSFGNVTVGSTSGAQAVTVSNTGGAAASGVAVASGSSEFVVSGNTCGATLNAGATCTFNVAYAPKGAGADSASVTVSYTGGSGPIAVSGTGTTAATASLSASPPLVAFGSVTVGQSSSGMVITVNNAGAAAATAVALSNSNPAEFGVSGNSCGATISAGGSCALTVKYTPSAPGADTATLTFNHAGGSLVVSLTGTGAATPPPPPPPGQGQLSMPSSVTLPDTALGTSSAPQSVTLSNIGSAAVTVSAVTSSSAEFAVGGINCATVNAGASCAFTVTFTPTAAGARSATITVADNGVGAPHIIAVGGTGVTGATPPPTGIATAFEYYHQEFDHYFMTSIADEIVKLDTGYFKGWTRTGRSFKVSTQKLAGLSVVCRFFSTAFGLKSSHFYTPQVEECAIVKGMSTWQFEDEVFTVQYPNLAGDCPANTVPVYRMYNQGQGGAPNHRYTTDLAVRAEMLAKGWIPEGEGKIGVIMCSPM
ncbi:MAG: choice-of-anchor D domain-containing protein, partial [Burkholderiales bacterium]|nr:choice-of-anchor D domain-containing protein [Burkholderiales bacterium]